MEVRLDIEDANYRLLQLTPKLQESLENGELSIRSQDGTTVYLCTADSTHIVRKLKQSNTLMLLRPVNNTLQAFASPTESLETVETNVKVNWSLFPPLDLSEKVIFHPLSVEKHGHLAHCSFAEFAEQCREKPVVASESHIYKVEPDLCHEILVQLISAMIEQGDFNLTVFPGDIAEWGADYPEELFKAVYGMFSDEPGALNKEKLSRWTGLYILKQHPNGLDIDRFRREWVLDLPAKLKTDLDLLQGFVAFPTELTICYVDSDALPRDINARLDSLFNVKREWPMKELQPFILPLMPVGQRLENWILKFARKRRVGKDFVISRLRR